MLSVALTCMLFRPGSQLFVVPHGLLKQLVSVVPTRLSLFTVLRFAYHVSFLGGCFMVRDLCRRGCTGNLILFKLYFNNINNKLVQRAGLKRERTPAQKAPQHYSRRKPQTTYSCISLRYKQKIQNHIHRNSKLS